MSDETQLEPKINLPEGAVFASAITAVSYFDENGKPAYTVVASGTSSFIQSVGLLEAAKAALIDQNNRRQ